MQALQDLADFLPQARNSAAGKGAPAPGRALRACRGPAHEAAQQSQQGRLAGAIVADDGDALAGGDGQLVDLQQGAAVGGRPATCSADGGRWRQRS
jgi:hypothetical protein